MHQENIIHFDLKLANVLVDETLDKLKICDFGLSKPIKNANATITRVIGCSKRYSSYE